jgi:hypothetical protein
VLNINSSTIYLINFCLFCTKIAHFPSIPCFANFFRNNISFIVLILTVCVLCIVKKLRHKKFYIVLPMFLGFYWSPCDGPRVETIYISNLSCWSLLLGLAHNLGMGGDTERYNEEYKLKYLHFKNCLLIYTAVFYHCVAPPPPTLFPDRYCLLFFM